MESKLLHVAGSDQQISEYINKVIHLPCNFLNLQLQEHH